MKAIAGITILVHNRKEAHCAINEELSKYGHIIHGRLGIPNIDNENCIISLIVHGSEEDIDTLYSELNEMSAVEDFKVLISKF